MAVSASSRLRVVNVTLPAFAKDEQEIVPVLLDGESGLPKRLALRWVMRDRRIAVGEKTLSDGLRAAALLYAFCDEVLKIDLDEHFADGDRLTPHVLDQLFEYLRTGRGGGRGVRALTTTAQLAANIERFLRWLADPSGRGGTAYVRPEELIHYGQRLNGILGPLRAFRGRGQRIPPLTADMDAALEELIGPIKGADGRYQVPLRFQDANPWKPSTRLRNWIAYRLGRELGLRRGEIGKIRIDDIQSISGETVVAVRRRPHDTADTRHSSNRPKVKTVERVLPVSSVLTQGLKQYQHTLLRDGGRRSAQTPYLLVTADGAPISGTSLDKMWVAPNRVLAELRMSWHVLRHTWGEETADQLLGEHQGALDSDEVVLGILRELGGWAPQSSTPFKYIQNAIRARGASYLRRRNARYDKRPPERD